MAGHVKYSEDLNNFVNEIIMGELEGMDFDTELEGSNSKFAIIPTVVSDNDCMPTAVYGIYNRETGVRETETRQHGAAKLWTEALANPAKASGSGGDASPFPGLGSSRKTPPTIN